MIFWKRWKLNSLRKKARNMMLSREKGNVSDLELKKEIALHYHIAAFYDKYRYDKTLPYAREMALEAYRAAASLQDSNAQFIIGERLIDLGRFWQDYKDTPYHCKVHDRYAADIFEEAFAYLEAAEAQQHPKAKRLRGLAFINAWGVAEDQDKGFKLVVDSIDMEQAWDRATQIFEETGLNKPDFFSTIMSLRHGNK